MRLFAPLRRAALSLALAACFFSYAAPAQEVRIPAEALADDTQLQAVLSQGDELEQTRRWVEAVAHYEDALRTLPDNANLRRRLDTARLHLDVTRRYSDASYRSSVARLNEQTAINVYDEVLSKINSNYVTEPNWLELVRRGSSQLDAALSEPDYLKVNLPGSSSDQVGAYRSELATVMTKYGARTREEARNLAAYASRLASQRLGLSSSSALMEFTCGAIGGLDEYSSFLTTAQLDDVFSQIKGNFVGLGVELKAENGALTIVNVISGGSAAQGGIRGGDRITAVDGKSTADVSTDAAADMLKGLEGTTVEVTVVTAEQAPRTIRLERRRVDLPSIENAKIIDAEYGVAYLKMPTFQETTARDLEASLWELHKAGMRSLIIDLRGNPGGLLNAAVEAADKFITNGTIVSTRGRSAREDYDYKAQYAGTWRVPLVVLIDGDSASASEIFAGAIHDHRRGYLVGQRSYGKGSVQGIFRLTSANLGVRLTTAKFYSPNGDAISKRGVTPDYVIQVAAKPAATASNSPATLADDAVLQNGIQAAKRQVSKK